MREELIAALSKVPSEISSDAFEKLRVEILRAITAAATDRAGRIKRRADEARASLAGIDAAILARVGPKSLALIADDDFDWPGEEDRALSLLLDARAEIAGEAAAWEMIADDANDATPVGQSRKLEPEHERLLQRIAAAWVEFADPRLPLPRRDADPDSPLLRFLDAVLARVFGGERPSKKAVLTYLADHVRPALRSKGRGA